MRASTIGAALAAAAAIGAGLAAGQAFGAMTIFGGGLAEACSKAAKADDASAATVELCTQALRSDPLTRRDRAGTLINRGILELDEDDLPGSLADFDAAIGLDPAVGEGWVDRGALDVVQKHYQQGVDDIDKALALGVSEPEKAYFNRAVAFEGLDDEKSAYFDYKKALDLKPGWELPERELLRFTVTQR
ncbi:MAG: tetratricopeptide repeat protein [Caulobacteraceae bacterium]